jgi:hypothetical protein
VAAPPGDRLPVCRSASELRVPCRGDSPAPSPLSETPQACEPPARHSTSTGRVRPRPSRRGRAKSSTWLVPWPRARRARNTSLAPRCASMEAPPWACSPATERSSYWWRTMAARARPQLKDEAGDQMKVTGTDVERGGFAALVVAAVAPAKQPRARAQAGRRAARAVRRLVRQDEASAIAALPSLPDGGSFPVCPPAAWSRSGRHRTAGSRWPGSSPGCAWRARRYRSDRGPFNSQCGLVLPLCWLPLHTTEPCSFTALEWGS